MGPGAWFFRRGTIYGGVFLPGEKDRTADRPIEPLPMPPRLRIPLLRHAGRPAEPCVEVGQTVRCGERIARPAGDDSLPVHASADGRVVALTTCDTPESPEVPCIEIEVRGAAVPVVRDARTVQTLEDLVAYAADVGLVDQDASGRATFARLRRAGRSACEHLIINGLESDPCITVDWRVLCERAEDVLAMADRLRGLLGARFAWLVIDAARRGAAARWMAVGRRLGIHVRPLPNRYPQGHPALLVRTLLRREIPFGGEDLDVGAFVIDATTLAVLESSLRTGMPVTQRILTVTGDAAVRAGNYLVPIGTPIREVVSHACEPDGERRGRAGLAASLARVVVGSPMTGVAIRDLDTVVTQGTRAILLLGDRGLRRGLPVACNRCGWCVDDCPVGLDPSALLNAAERRRLDRAGALHAQACIECGLCSYVCPARLPLAESIRALKRELARAQPVRAIAKSPGEALTR